MIVVAWYMFVGVRYTYMYSMDTGTVDVAHEEFGRHWMFVK